jgi:hypothetical protein
MLNPHRDLEVTDTLSVKHDKWVSGQRHFLGGCDVASVAETEHIAAEVEVSVRTM